MYREPRPWFLEKIDPLIVMGFAGMAVLFFSIAAAVILGHGVQNRFLSLTHRVPTTTWRTVIINPGCCSSNTCLIERHHEGFQFEYKTVQE